MNNSEILAAAQKAADTAQAAAGVAQEAAEDATYKLAELKESMAVKAWPQGGDAYFCSEGTETIYGARWDGCSVDRSRMAKGNVYRTRDEAGQADRVLIATTKVLARIKELRGDWVPDFIGSGSDKCSFMYDHQTNSLLLAINYTTQSAELKYYFPERIHKQLKEELHPEILLMLGVNSGPSKHSPTD